MNEDSRRYQENQNAFMQEAHGYLRKVQQGRAVRAHDPLAPQYSQAADDERLARQQGLGQFIRQGPPAPEQQVAPPLQIATPTPPPPRNTLGERLLGTAKDVHGFLNARNLMNRFDVEGRLRGMLNSYRQPSSPSRNLDETRQLERLQREQAEYP